MNRSKVNRVVGRGWLVDGIKRMLGVEEMVRSISKMKRMWSNNDKKWVRKPEEEIDTEWRDWNGQYKVVTEHRHILSRTASLHYNYSTLLIVKNNRNERS